MPRPITSIPFWLALAAGLGFIAVMAFEWTIVDIVTPNDSHAYLCSGGSQGHHL